MEEEEEEKNDNRKNKVAVWRFLTVAGVKSDVTRYTTLLLVTYLLWLLLFIYWPAFPLLDQLTSKKPSRKIIIQLTSLFLFIYSYWRPIIQCNLSNDTI